MTRRPATQLGTVAREPDAVQRDRVPANDIDERPEHQRLDAPVRGPVKPPALATADGAAA